MKVKSESEVTQSCPTLRDPMDCNPPGSSIHAIFPGKSTGVGCSPWGHNELDTTERIHFHFSLSCIGEGNGNPLQCSCLEDPRYREAWWAAVYGVAQSQTRLKYISSSSIVIFFKLITQNVISSIILFPNMQINCRP